MANDPDFIEFIVDQIDSSCDIRYRHMFGGTTLYSHDKVVEALPYEGAKNSLLIGDQIEDGEWLTGGTIIQGAQTTQRCACWHLRKFAESAPAYCRRGSGRTDTPYACKHPATTSP